MVLCRETEESATMCHPILLEQRYVITTVFMQPVIMNIMVIVAYQVINYVKQSPFEDSEDIAEEGECKRQKPHNKESRNNNEPCVAKRWKRHMSLQGDSVNVKDISSIGMQE